MAAIDVLMPFRDAAPWIGDAWGSLVRQRFRDWRLVAVDDGSRDGSADRLVAAAGGDPRLHLVPAPARGVAAALNRGLDEVNAPVVVRMDADDLSHPARLETLWHFLGRHPDAGVAATRVRLFPAGRVSPAMGRYLAWQNGLLDPGSIRRERFVECTVTHASVAVRTAVLEACGGWWEGDGPEDLDLFLRLHRRGVRFVKHPRVLYCWRERAGRETRTSPRMSPAAFRAVKARYLAEELAGRGTVSVLGTGRSLDAWAGALAEQAVPVRVSAYRPGRPPPGWDGVAVFCFGSPRARDRVRRVLRGRREGEDYWFVA